MKNGSLIISLDFELHWGIFDHTTIQDTKEYFNKTLHVIPEILKLFSKYEIKATWASVGFLFNKDINDVLVNNPSELPNYQDKILSSYEYIKNNRDLIISNKDYYIAPHLVYLINQTKGQEIGSHTYSHYYCLEKGQDVKTFKSDLQKHFELANTFGIELESLVYPRNQYNKVYNEVCSDLGIKSVRTNPNIWFWDENRKETYLKRLFRLIDAYLPISKTIYDYKNIKKETENTPYLIPASRFFRPLSSIEFINRLRIKRIKNEMSEAAKNGMLYHLWWHPHNFGNNPKRALFELTELLEFYSDLKIKYGFKSNNMSGIIKLYN